MEAVAFGPSNPYRNCAIIDCVPSLWQGKHVISYMPLNQKDELLLENRTLPYQKIIFQVIGIATVTLLSLGLIWLFDEFRALVKNEIIKTFFCFEVTSTINMKQHLLNRIMASSSAKQLYGEALLAQRRYSKNPRQEISLRLDLPIGNYLSTGALCDFSGRIAVAYRQTEDAMLKGLIFELGNLKQIHLFPTIGKCSSAEEYAKKVLEIEFQTKAITRNILARAVEEDGWDEAMLSEWNTESGRALWEGSFDNFWKFWHKTRHAEHYRNQWSRRMNRTLVVD